MSIFYYISIYVLIGAVFMAILDLLHRMVRNHLDEDFKKGYENWERIYIIFTWPAFVYSVIKEIIINSKQK